MSPARTIGSALCALAVLGAARVNAEYRLYRVHYTSAQEMGVPALNNAREVMYLLQFPTGVQLYSSGSNGGAYTYYADTYGSFSEFNSWAIDDYGNGVWAATLDGSGAMAVTALYSGETQYRPVVQFSGSQEFGVPVVMSIDAGRVVVASSTYHVYNAAYFWSGGSPIVLASANNHPGFRNASLNASGQILVSGPTHELFGTVMGGLQPVGLIRWHTSTLNDDGRAAEVRIDRITMYGPSDGFSQVIADTSGGFAAFHFDAISLNNRGRIAFIARRDDGVTGVFAGPDPVSDLVVRIGQSFGGRTITDVFIGPNALNDRGQIAIWLRLSGPPNSVIVLADPLSGDVTMDCTINVDDLSRLLSNFGASTYDYFDGDIVQNQRVDIQDLAALLAQLGQACP